MFRPTRQSVRVRFLCSFLVLGCTGSIEDGKSGANGTTPPTSSGGKGSDPSTPLGADAPVTCGPTQLGPAPLHRLTRLEYDNTIRDLIGEDLKLAKDFAFDERAGEFAANFFTPIDEMQFAQYAAAAETVADKAAGNMKTVVTCDPAAADCAGTFIKQFGRRAFRRPLEDVEVAAYQKIFDTGRTGVDFANGVRLVVQAMLQSPKFLYLIEGPGPLTQHQMAARLSYFLWNAPPDAALSAAADGNKLGTMAAVHEQAKRLLADPRSLDMIVDFHTQWLGLEELPVAAKDEMIYPQFEMLRPSIIEETGRFLGEVMKTDGGRLDTLLQANFAVVNGPLAALYGAGGPATADWHKVMLDPTQRSGLLTLSSFLTAQGAYDGSSPIKRGLRIREQVLCAPMPVPPPDVNQNPPPPAPHTTTRQRFDRHRTDPVCAACHEMMDKLGYGFEGYDGIGTYRTTENSVPIDDSGEVIATDVDGPFKGAPALGKRLAGSTQVQKCMTTQWFRYALGRMETDLDKCVLDELNKKYGGANLKLADLLLGIVESDAFRTYRPVN
jgi:hypothetical protein